jgi:uncharacterized protein (UPF0264 family)
VSEDLALSLKQPWAALVVHGRKTIEVRSWQWAVRGRVLIHAARRPDDRPEAWAWVTPEVATTATLRGGIIGAAELADVRTYTALDAFNADRPLHLNEPAWFRPPRLFGFVFCNAVVLPFARCPGQTLFFRLQQGPTSRKRQRRIDEPEALVTDQQTTAVADASGSSGGRPRLLVSVRSVEEVGAALAGGAALIDVKEPQRGSLGRADDETITAVVRAVHGQAPVSAALGEWNEPLCRSLPSAIDGIAFVKWGLAGCGGVSSWQPLLRVMRRHLAEHHPGVRLVVAAYADWQRAGAPPPGDVCAFACDAGLGGFLVDTWGKDGSTLTDWVPVQDLHAWRQSCGKAGVQMALAGNLGPGEIEPLLDVAPDWFAMRGAACRGGRTGIIDADRVRALAELLAAAPWPDSRGKAKS